jgi:hypothetical protein
MSAPVWTIKRGSDGLEQSVAAWGLNNMVIDRQTAGQDKATFTAIVQAADGAAIFNDFDTAIIYRTDPVTGVKVSWFSGLWTKTPRDMAPNSESLSYELSGGPWWYLAHCAVQTTWNATNGITGTLAGVLQALMIIGMNPELAELEKIDLFTYLATALQYCIQACALQTVAFVPFTIGTISATDFIIPQEQVKNLSCAQLIQHVLRWIPDASFWVDYSTMPPTINIVQRPALAAVNLPAFGGVCSKIVKLTPRTDLQVSNVVLKYQLSNTVDGQTFTAIESDIYPAGSSEFNLRALVSTMDLDGGHETFQKNPVTVAARPVSPTDSVAMSWVMKKYKWIFAQTVPGTYDYDVANISLTDLTQTICADDPLAGSPPDLATLVEEWITGQHPDWLHTNFGVVTARVDVVIILGYSGSDPKTLGIFGNNPVTPNTRREDITLTATNASTGTYERLTSEQASETPPPGLAENIYNATSVLHYEGSIELTEQECSGLVKLGSVLNLTGSLVAWSTMNAQVISIAENIDQGKTSVRFGPSVTLGQTEWIDLFRAMRGRIPTWSLNQAKTGDPSNADVKGHIHTTHEARTSPGGGGGTSTQVPYSGIDSSSGATPQVTVRLGSHAGLSPTFLGPFTVPTGVSYISVSCPFTYDVANNVTVTSNTINQSPTPSPASTCTPGGSGRSGTFSQDLFRCTATVTAGKASVTFEQIVGGSQNFGVCAGAISGPWGV